MAELPTLKKAVKALREGDRAADAIETVLMALSAYEMAIEGIAKERDEALKARADLEAAVERIKVRVRLHNTWPYEYVLDAIDQEVGR